MELLVTFHSTMADQLNSRLSESPRFFAFVIAALTAYAFVISHYQSDRFMLVLVSFISYMVLQWAIWYMAALGYAFRFLQYSMHLAEVALDWTQYSLEYGVPPKTRSFSRTFWLHPGIYHAHLAGLIIIVCIVCAVFSFKWWRGTGAFGHPQCEALTVLSCGVVGSLLWTLFINNHYVNKYEDKANVDFTKARNTVGR